MMERGRTDMENLKSLATAHEIVCFWDKPSDATKDTVYEIYVNGKKACDTTKTHATIQHLTSDTDYDIRVTRKDSEETASISCKTRVERRKRDVVKEFGAVGDGQTINTDILQRAIDACTGEDVLYFPKGIYMSGALRLHSDMEIYLEEGAVLQGTDSLQDYAPKIKSRFEGYEMECYQSLINIGELNHKEGANCENILIYGKGSIYGGGEKLAKETAKSEAIRLKKYIEALGDKINEYEKPETIASRARGRLINISNGRNIWIHGLKLGKAPSWNVHFIYSDEIYTDDCTFYSQGIWNGDGWDPDSSTNSTIFNCSFYTEDDSVAIKSGKNPEGNVINRPTKNIRVFDCITHFGHGICMGSEMSGGIEQVKIWDCEVGPTWSGIEIKATKKRGGYVRDIEVRDVTASHIQVHSVGYNDDGIGAPVPPVFENCTFRNMHLLGRYLDNNAGRDEWHECPAIHVQGFDLTGHKARNMIFDHIEFEGIREDVMEHVLLKDCENIAFSNLSQVKINPIK